MARRDNKLLSDSAPAPRMDSKEIVARLKDAPDNVAAIRSVRKSISREIAHLDAAAVLGIAHQLIGNARYGRFVAYELVQNHAPAMQSLRRKEIEKLGHGISDWAAVDTFACYVAGPAWRAGQIGDDVITDWANSDDRWWRRAALVSTVPLNSGVIGAGDAKRTLAVCLRLVDDRDDMVVKAMSWALRALSKRDQESVKRFLERHRSKLAARVIREVQNKLNTGLKNPRSGSRT